MKNLGARAYHDTLAFVAPTIRERRWAIGTATLMVALVVAVIPSGHTFVGEIPAFLPAFGTLTILAMALITQIIGAQYRSSGLPAFGFLGLAYLAQAVLTTAYLLTFPRMFSPYGLFGAGPQSAAYLYLAWHLAFFALIGAYLTCTAYTATRPHALRRADRALRITAFTTVVVSVVGAIVAIRYSDRLPTVIVNGHTLSAMFSDVYLPLVLACNVIVLAFLFRVTRFRTVVDMWLALALLGILCESLLASTFSGGRYTVGWYVARIEWLAASLVFLVVLVNRMNAIIARLATSNEELSTASDTDPLTGLCNRRGFDTRYRDGVTRAAQQIAPYALLYIDIDEFKRYNDAFGHLQGDQTLRLVSQAIARVLSPPQDFAARLGGEEFAVALPNTKRSGAQLVATAIHESIAALDVDQYDGCVTTRLTVSIGLAATEDDRDGDHVSLLARADRALYCAKRAGRNRTEIAA